MKERTYYEEKNIENIKKLRELEKELPSYVTTFFRGIEPHTASRTRIAYAYDLGIFFEYIKENNPLYADKEVTDFPLEILDQITALDIEEYLEYLSYYVKDNSEHQNTERGKMRKLASLRTLYNYYYRKEMIKTNPASIVSMPKIHQKEIVRLDIDEVARLLDEVEQGDNLTKREQN